MSLFSASKSQTPQPVHPYIVVNKPKAERRTQDFQVLGRRCGTGGMGFGNEFSARLLVTNGTLAPRLKFLK